MEGISPAEPQRVIYLSDRVSDNGDDTPPAPEFLSDLAVGAWDRLAPLYMLRPHDLPEFAAYCEAVAEFEEATDLIKDGGLIAIDPASGLPIPSPFTTVRNSADRKIASWANRFKDSVRGR